MFHDFIATRRSFYEGWSGDGAEPRWVNTHYNTCLVIETKKDEDTFGQPNNFHVLFIDMQYAVYITMHE